MTVKQKKFADEYIITGNATQSAINAGYSEKTARSIGQENLTKPDIKSYIDERMAKIDEESIADQKEVMQYLTRLMRGEEVEVEIIDAGDFTQDTVEVPVKHRERIKAAELIGKRYGIWTEKQEIDISGAVEFLDDID